MLEDLSKKLFFARFEILSKKAFREGKILEFDDEIFDEMSDTIIACLPVSLHIKHSRHTFPLGTCYDQSLYMFLALDDALLVRGNNKDLVYNYGKGHGGHGWIERGGYVYDPSLMLKFDKDTYYDLYGCSDVVKIDKTSYLKDNQDFVDEHVSHSLEDFKPGGKRRLELGLLIIQLRALSSMIGDQEFTKDLDDYLNSIEYDEVQIQREREAAIQKVLKDKNRMAIVNGN